MTSAADGADMRSEVRPTDGSVDDASSGNDMGLAQESPWPMLGFGPARQFRSPIVSAQSAVQRWKMELSYPIYCATPSIGLDGTIYLAASDAALHAIHPDGTVRWAVKVGSTAAAAAVGADGTVYIAANSVTPSTGKLTALRPDGTTRWITTIGPSAYSSPVVAGGIVYVGSDNGLFAIASDGSQRWMYSARVGSSASIAADGTICFSDAQGDLTALHADGTLKWKVAIPHNMAGATPQPTPTIADDGTIYVAGSDGSLHAFDASGVEQWEIVLGAADLTSGVFLALASDGTIYFPSDQLFAVNPSGTLKWKFGKQHDELRFAAAVGGDGTVYVGGLQGFFAVNADGTQKWSWPIGNGNVCSGPSIGADGTLYMVGAGSSTDTFQLAAFGP